MAPYSNLVINGIPFNVDGTQQRLTHVVIAVRGRLPCRLTKCHLRCRWNLVRSPESTQCHRVQSLSPRVIGTRLSNSYVAPYAVQCKPLRSTALSSSQQATHLVQNNQRCDAPRGNPVHSQCFDPTDTLCIFCITCCVRPCTVVLQVPPLEGSSWWAADFTSRCSVALCFSWWCNHTGLRSCLAAAL